MQAKKQTLTLHKDSNQLNKTNELWSTTKKKATAIELQESNKIIQVEEERTWKPCQQNKRVTFTKQKRIATPPPK